MTQPEVIFEDESLIVINKPAGLSSEAGVIGALRALWGREGAYVGIVHRLDTGVEGLMVCAKTPEAAAALSRQITQSQNAYAALDGRAGAAEAGPPCFIKKYRAVIPGAPGEGFAAGGVMRDLLFKDGRSGRVYPVKRARKGVKEAVLEYRVLASAAGASLVEITLHTGRTHQIRVQFASRGRPLYGDGKYGSREKGNIALQSAFISFKHPVSGQALSFELPAPATPPWNLFS